MAVASPMSVVSVQRQHNDTLIAALPAHLIQLRLARVRPHPMTATTRDAQLEAREAAVRVQMLRWPGFHATAVERAVRLHGLFDIPNTRVMTDGTQFQQTRLGVAAAQVQENAPLEVVLNRTDVLALAPAGSPKLLCLSNPDVPNSFVHHQVLPTDTAERITLKLPSAGSYSQAKVLSIMPYGHFRVIEGSLSAANTHYRDYIDQTGKTTYLRDITIQQMLDNDGVDTAVKANNIAVDDHERIPIGMRTRYKKLHGLVYPTSALPSSARANLGVWAYDVAPRMTQVLSASRINVISALSWVEGSFDSINTYDAVDRFSWGIAHWISNTGTGRNAALNGELNHLLAYIYREHETDFHDAFSAYGFSVWYDDSAPIVYGQRGDHTPFKNPVILRVDCHGTSLTNALTNLRTARWQNRRAIYAAWVFRKAGLREGIQRAQVEMLNHRMTSHLPGGAPSERQVADALNRSINPGDPLNRAQRVTDCVRDRGLTLSTTPGSFEAALRPQPGQGGARPGQGGIQPGSGRPPNTQPTGRGQPVPVSPPR